MPVTSVSEASFAVVDDPITIGSEITQPPSAVLPVPLHGFGEVGGIYGPTELSPTVGVVATNVPFSQSTAFEFVLSVAHLTPSVLPHRLLILLL